MTWWGLAAILLITCGLFTLGLYAGLSLTDDRAEAAEAAEDIECGHLAALAAAILEAEAGPDWRVPGYADPFPRAGRFILSDPPLFTHRPAAVTLIDMAPVSDAPHGRDSRPPTSPDDLDPAVRRLCEDTQLYVAALIARTRHAEGK